MAIRVFQKAYTTDGYLYLSPLNPVSTYVFFLSFCSNKCFLVLPFIWRVENTSESGVSNINSKTKAERLKMKGKCATVTGPSTLGMIYLDISTVVLVYELKEVVFTLEYLSGTLCANWRVPDSTKVCKYTGCCS